MENTQDGSEIERNAMNEQEHCEKVYKTKSADAVSWFQQSFVAVNNGPEDDIRYPKKRTLAPLSPHHWVSCRDAISGQASLCAAT